jgi:hypothetical protein
MPDLQKENATGQGGACNVEGGQAKATKQKKAFNCGAHHINKVVREIQHAGLQLRSAAGDTQLATLPKVLEHLGTRGANTYELVALGYLRAATRVKDLEDRYQIVSLREDVVGPDGLLHKGVARYVLLGQKKTTAAAQGQLELGVA